MTLQEKWVAFSTISIKEISRLFRIWPQTLLPAVITTILYFVIFGHVIGRHLGTMTAHIPYASFIAPGLIMMQMITSAYSASVSAFYGAKYQRHIEELLVSPMSNFLILLGYMSAGIVRGLLIGILVTLVAVFFAPLQFHHVGMIFLVGFIACAIFSLGGVINAVYAKKFDDIAIIPTFVLTPLTYFGGVFYSINALPPFWQKASLFNPIFYIVDVFRYGFLGLADPHFYTAIVMIIGLLFALFIGALYIFRSGAGLRT